MKSPSSFTNIFIHREPVDMRKGINGLCELAQLMGAGSLTSPHLFVFAGRRKHMIKVLYFDKSGFCLWQKRLDEARFAWPKKLTAEVVEITPEVFSWLLDGYDVWKMKPFDEIKFERVS